MLTSKLPNVGTTIFTRMSQLAAECGALNFSQGFPDFDSPAPLLEAVARHVMAGHNQYSPMTGLPALREQVAAKVAGLYGRNVSADTEVTIVPGATEGIFCAVQALIRPGDEAIVLDPCYDSYEPSVELAGGRCVHVPLSLPDFRIDWQRMADAITPRTRLIFLNSPHNPSGSLIDRADLDRLAALIRDREIYVISDEVYEHLIYDGVQHASVLAHDELYPRAFVISSFGKTYHVTGWKTGYVVAPPTLSAEMRKIHQYVNFCGVTPLQWALADYMAAHPEHLHELPGFYQAKRDLFCDLLESSRFHFQRAAGTYFQVVDYSTIRPDLDDVAMSEWLTREHGVAAIPVSVFYQQPPADMRLVRFCFAKKEETLRQAAERLCAI
ncbi:pyridoxal phosphate-dependent aminotransferase [Pseudomonas sp. SCB32]|uniref:pyridoxal phosphate-dependent aminotransferase n=1 Tax=Pseudomonas sp. SCB32 TaxID=2653853 RepID=UPI001264A074|nr:pyridoxal phosphate-dependent aminotransferase [Pseudomonas sp. SCB32]